jgi:hypothetical protein
MLRDINQAANIATSARGAIEEGQRDFLRSGSEMVQRSDRDTPNIVLAPGRDRSAVIRLYANPLTIRQLVDDNYNAKIGEYVGLVHGNIMERVGDAPMQGGTDGLMAASALYQGIKRPRINPGGDERVLVYVTNPPHSYTYPDRNALPIRAPKPKDSVFVAYAELFADGLDRSRLEGAPSEIDGVVHFWEWVISSEEDRLIPAGAAGRYAACCWGRER